MRIAWAVLCVVFSVMSVACSSPVACNGCSGCCDNGKCVNGTSSLACGSDGFACTVCGNAQQCSLGVCVNNGGGGGGGGGHSSGPGNADLITGPDGGRVVSIATGDTCSGFGALYDEAANKLAGCPNYEPYSPRALNEANCRVLLPSCTSGDRAQLDVFMNCLRRVPPCASIQSEFFNRLQSCMPLTTSLTPACQAAFYP